MIIKLDTVLKNLDGTGMYENVTGKDGKVEKKDITLMVVLKHSLAQPLQGDDRAKKEKDFTLMIRIVTCKDKKGVDLSSEDITRLKEKVYELYDALVAGQVAYLLEGKEIPF